MSQERADHIVASARRVMADFGARRTTVGDVAKAADVSRQTVYEYFANREQLVRAALAAGARDVVRRGLDVAEHTDGDAEERLTLLLQTALRFFRESPLWASTAKRAELAPFVTLEGTVFLGAGTQAIADALRLWWPEVAPTRIDRAADVLARQLVSHGLAPEDADIDEVGRELANLVARGLT